MKHSSKILIFVLFAVLSLSCVFGVSAEVTAAQARGVLDDVSVSLEKAFVAVADAEAAGANVTGLKAKLNQSGVLLAYANASFSVANYTGAVALALQANETVNGVQTEASELAISARENWSMRLNWALLESSIGVSLAVFFVLVVWVYFKRYYVRRVLGWKPEVRKTES